MLFTRRQLSDQCYSVFEQIERLGVGKHATGEYVLKNVGLFLRSCSARSRRVSRGAL